MTTADRTRRLVALLALLFFFGPNADRLGGVRPEAIENRALRPFPTVAQGWRFLPDLDAWAVDHLPLRGTAVRADDTLSQDLFDEPSTRNSAWAAIIRGRDGWLFLRQEIRERCAPYQPLSTTLAQAARLADMVTSLGHRFVVTVAPDKSAIEGRMLPARYPQQDCAQAANDAFWQRMRATPPPGYLDLYGALAALAARDGHAYYATDTHWLPAGAERYAYGLVDRVYPAELDPIPFVLAGTVSRHTDLVPLYGEQHVESVPAVRVSRPGVTVRYTTWPLPGPPHLHSVASTTGPPLFRQPVLILGDSFTERSMDLLAPFFADLTYAHTQLFLYQPALIARLIRTAAVVVLEVVQRDFESGAVPVLAPAALDSVVRQVRLQMRCAPCPG